MARVLAEGSAAGVPQEHRMFMPGTDPAVSVPSAGPPGRATGRPWPAPPGMTARPRQAGSPPSHLLAALGTVLCAYRPALGDPLAGWRQACRVAVHQRLDSDGLDECLWFFDAGERCCWRVFLLPESDFLAWDALLDGLPSLATPPVAGLAERMWRRLGGRVRGDTWCTVPLRLRAAGVSRDGLEATPAFLSETGRATAERLARSLDG